MRKLVSTAVLAAFALIQAPAYAQDKSADKKPEAKAEAKKADAAPAAKKAEAAPAEAKKDEKKPKKGGC